MICVTKDIETAQSFNVTLITEEGTASSKFLCKDMQASYFSCGCVGVRVGGRECMGERGVEGEI